MWLLMQNNVYSANVRLWFVYITWVHIHAKFEEDLLNISAIISKKYFEQMEMLHQTINSLGVNKTSKYLDHKYTLY